MNSGLINRREALVLLAAGIGGTVFGGRRLFGAEPRAAPSPSPLSPSDLDLLNEVAETILPATAKSEGAKAANVAGFMDEMVQTYYEDEERAAFVAGIGELQADCHARSGGRSFLDLGAEERLAFLLALDAARPQPGYYRMIRQLTIFGYFTSEIGATHAMAHVAVPGRFEGVVKVQPGTRVWSS